jgi:L-asparaginase
MTPEMAFVKIQFALSQQSDFDALQRYLATDQCGEMAV